MEPTVDQPNGEAEAANPSPELPAKDPAEAICPLLALMVVVSVCGAYTSRFIPLWAAIGGAELLLMALAVHKTRPRVAAQLKPTGLLLGLGVLAGAVMLAATYGLYPIALGYAPALREPTAKLYTLFQALPDPLLPAVLPLIILAEEVVWRGRLQDALQSRLHPLAAAAVGAVVYAFVHAPSGEPLLVGIALLCGLYWGALRAVTGSVVPGLVAHLLWDFPVMVLIPLVR